MDFQFPPYAITYVLTAGVCAATALIAWRRRSVPGGLPIVLLMIAITEWAATAALEAGAIGEPAKLFWSAIEYVGTVSCPPLFLIFALQYTRQDRWLTRRNVALLWVIPLITLLLAATNEWHRWVWSSTEPSTAGQNILRYNHGSWFWINVTFSYVIVFVAALALIWALIRFPNSYRQQAATLLMGALVPVVGNVIYVLGLSPIPGLDLTPLTFAVTGLLIAWSIFRLQLFNLVPVARDVLIESLSDGVLVLDEQNRIVDINPAARKLLRQTPAVIGQPARGLLPAWPELARFRDTLEAYSQVAVSQDPPFYLDLRISPLYDRRGTWTGRLVILRDITEEKLAQDKLRQLSRAVEQSPDSVVITDTSGNIEYVNPKFTRLTGYSLKEAVGQNPRILKSGETPLEEYRRLWNTIQSGGEWHGEFRNRKKNGELYWESAAISPITDAQGNITHFLAIKEDITERKRIEQDEREQRALAEALRGIIAVLNSTLDLNQVLDLILTNIGQVVPNDAVNLMLIDPQTGLVQVARRRGYKEHGQDRIAPTASFSVMEMPSLVHMAETGQPTVVFDTRHSPDWVSFGEQDWQRSYAAAPIRIQGQTVGFLNLDSATPGFFTQAHADRLQTFADQAAIAIQNARLYTEAQQRAEQMATINRIGLAATSGLDMQEVLRALLEQCRQVLPMDSFHVAVYDDKTGMIHYPLFYDRGDYRTAAARNVRTHPGLSGEVIQTRAMLHLPDTLDEETAQKHQIIRTGGEPTRSYVGAPLIARDRVVGMISMQSYQPHTYTPEDIHMFETIATQAAIAVENSRLFEETRQRAERMSLLNDISMSINLSGELNSVLQAAVDGLARVLNIAQVGVAMFDKTHQHLTVMADHPAPGNASAVGVELPVEGNLSVQRILLTQSPLTVEDVRQDSLMANVREVMVRQRVYSILIVPLIVRGRVIGTVGCDAIESPRQFAPEEIELAQTVAALVALRIEQARLFDAERIARQQAQRRATDLSGLYAITRATSRSLVTEDVLSQALSSALVSLGYEAGLIALAEAGKSSSDLRVVAERGLPAVLSQRLKERGLDNTLIIYVHKQHEIMLIDDLSLEQSVVLQEMIAQMDALDWRAFVGIPLLQQERSLGVMCLFSRQPRPTASQDLALLAGMGQQIATAVSNAQLFQATLNERSRLKALIESSRDGIILSDLNGHIVIINAPALQILHLPGQTEDWLGTHLSAAINLLHEFAPTGFEAAMAEIERIQTGDEPPIEGEAEVPPRAIRWQSLPVKVGAKPMGRLIVLRDMTEERAVERMREDMTHTMVHDLRNPLTSMLMSVEFLIGGAMGELTSQQSDALTITRRNTRRMMDLVTAILDVSRLESGRMPIEAEAFSLDELAAEVLQAQTALANEKGIHLGDSLPATLPAAWADRGLIHRVVQNLIGNGIKFTPHGGMVSIVASLDEQASPPMLLVSVSDTGSGIPPEIQGRLFQKFVTGGQEGRGSGLGLAFCKLAVEAHGGHIWVDSIPGHGTTFTFTVPIAPDQPA